MGNLNESVPLFWSPKYLELGPKDSFQWRPGLQTLEALGAPHEECFSPLISLKSVGEKLVSPAGASFGGFWVPDNLIDVFKGKWTDLYRQLGTSLSRFSSLEIFFPSDFFHPELFVPQLDELLSIGAQIIEKDDAFYIDVNNWTPADSLNHGNRKKLRQQDEQYVSSFTVPHSELATVYKVIEDNRAAMGVKPSLTFLQLQKQIEEMPNNFQLFLTQHEGVTVAGAVTVRISSTTQYVLYWADTSDARALSTVVGLCREIVRWCKSNGITYLDLGGTNADGVANEGLKRFKSNLGALVSPKTKVLLTLN